MDTVLNWTNLGAPGTFVTKIYRGTAPLDRANLANPIATLSAGENTYTDTTTVRDTLYYYVFETIVGADKQSTPNIPIRAVPRKGPGPTGLLIGDFTYGYFGSMQSGELINTNDLRAAVGLTIGSVNQQGPIWHKWIRNGKVLYVPNGPLCGNISWKALYDLGLVYGVDGAGPSNAGANVNQSAKVTIGGEQFRVRLMTGFDDTLARYPVTPVSTEPTELWPNEWNDLIYPLSMYCPELQRMANVQQATVADLGMALTGVTVGSIVQERISAGNAVNSLLRGNTAANRTGIANRTHAAYNSATNGWWPVLELIEA
jgi:hypothetical protein